MTIQYDPTASGFDGQHQFSRKPMTNDERVRAETWVKRWFCQNNEILWERGGHYKEEVDALIALLRETS